MRYSQGIEIAETKKEFLAMLKKPKAVAQKAKRAKAGQRRFVRKYLDVTATFDIETTNTETDGFAYSFQTCIGGAVIIPRYFED